MSNMGMEFGSRVKVHGQKKIQTGLLLLIVIIVDTKPFTNLISFAFLATV